MQLVVTLYLGNLDASAPNRAAAADGSALAQRPCGAAGRKMLTTKMSMIPAPTVLSAQRRRKRHDAVCIIVQSSSDKCGYQETQEGAAAEKLLGTHRVFANGVKQRRFLQGASPRIASLILACAICASVWKIRG